MLGGGRLNRLAGRFLLQGRGAHTDAGYDAFISYSHGADLEFAPSLQRGLRMLAKPWNRRYALRVFLDKTHLPASTDLSSELVGPISDTKFFILLASTQAASSTSYVGKEVSYWRDHKDMGKFLIAKTDGEISWDATNNDFDWEKTTALPRSLSRAFPSEPNYVDFSAEPWQAGVELGADPAFREAVARLAAPIHDKKMEELVGEDLDQQRRTKRLVRAAVTTLIALLVAASAAAFLAYQQRNTARTQLARATSLVLASAADKQPARDFDVSLLLSLEAYRSSPTAEAASTMITALEAARSSGATSILRTPFDSVESVALSPGAHTVAAAGGDGTVLLWDTRLPRRLVQTLSGGGGDISLVAFSPDGQTLAAARGDGAIVLWDVRATPVPDRPFQILKGTRPGVSDIVFSPVGHRLASASLFGTVLVWDTRAWDRHHLRIARKPALTLKTGQDSVRGIAFSPDGHTLATAGDDGTVRLWDTRRTAAPGRSFRTFKGHQGWVYAVAFSPDRHTLASAGYNGTVLLWDTRRTHEPIRPFRRLKGNRHYVNDIEFRDSHTLASTGDDGNVMLWDTRDTSEPGKPYLTLAGPRAKGFDFGEVSAVAFGGDGRTLASAGADGAVRLWDTRAHPQLGDSLYASQGAVNGVAFSPDGRRLASAGDDGTVRFWDTHDRRIPRKPVQTLDTKQGSVAVVAYSRDGAELATAGEDGTVRLWDASGERVPLEPELTLPRQGESVSDVAFSPDGHTLASAGVRRDPGDSLKRHVLGRVLLWDTRDPGKPVHILPSLPNAVTGLAFSPDGNTLATVGEVFALTTLLWDLRRTPLPTEPTQTLPGQRTNVADLTFSPDGNTLVTAGGGIALWDARQMPMPSQPDQTMSGDQDFASGVAFSPDGHTLASAGTSADGEHGTVLLWDARAHIPIGRTLNGDEGTVSDVAFSPDGRTLASAGNSADGEHGTVLLWQGILWHDTDDLKEQVCELVVGNLTRAEWDALVPGLRYQTTCPD